MEEIDKIKKEKEVLEQRLQLYENNGGIGLYYELNRFINGTVALMRKQSLESLLTTSKDEDAKKFERMMTLIKNAKEHVTDMEEMKHKLGITGDEDKDKLRRVPFNDRIADKRE